MVGAAGPTGSPPETEPLESILKEKYPELFSELNEANNKEFMFKILKLIYPSITTKEQLQGSYKMPWDRDTQFWSGNEQFTSSFNNIFKTGLEDSVFTETKDLGSELFKKFFNTERQQMKAEREQQQRSSDHDHAVLVAQGMANRKTLRDRISSKVTGAILAFSQKTEDKKTVLKGFMKILNKWLFIYVKTIVFILLK